MNTKIFKQIIAIIAVLLTVTGATAQEAKRMFIMENGVVTHKIAVSDIDSILLHSPYPTVDDGVIINGVKWATRNVAEPGHFALIPEDAGMFYKWNSNIAWPLTGEVTGWGDRSAGDVWEKANDPSPAGWHVPTLDEINKLLDANNVSSEWITVNGINGMKFTDKKSENSIFLPAANSRQGGGILWTSGSYCAYWSNTVGSLPLLAFAYAMFLSINEIELDPKVDRGLGFNIRPVAD